MGKPNYDTVLIFPKTSSPRDGRPSIFSSLPEVPESGRPFLGGRFSPPPATAADLLHSVTLPNIFNPLVVQEIHQVTVWRDDQVNKSCDLITNKTLR